MNWWQLAPVVLTAIAVAFLPGYLVVRSWAFTGWVAVGTAVPTSISIIGVAAVGAGILGVPWSPAVVVIPTIFLATVGIVLRTLLPYTLNLHSHPRPTLPNLPRLAAFCCAVAIPAVLIGLGLKAMIIAPDRISQTYDNIFHLNAIRFILETRSGSSLTLGGVQSYGKDPSLYPAAWHDLVTLVIKLSGASIPVAVNAVTIAIGSIAWPLSAIFLTTRATGARPVPALFAGALSSVFGSFPYLMVDFGALYPYFLAIAVLPAGLALATMAAGVGERGGTPRWLAAVWLVALVAPGIALSHPSAMLALLVFVVPVFVVAIVRYQRTLRSGRAVAVRYWTLVGLLLGYLVAAAVVWARIRPSEDSSMWRPVQTESQAIGQILTAGFIRHGPAWIVLALTIIAIPLVVRRRFNWWVLGVYLLAGFLFFVVSAVHPGQFRTFVTGVWYNDSHRLAGQLPVITVVVCTIAATWLFARFRSELAQRFARLAALRPARRESTATLALAVVAAIALGIIGQYSSVNAAIYFGKQRYDDGPDARLLSDDERTLLERIDEMVPRDATIIGNPWKGTSLAYALGNRRTLTPHVKPIPPDVDRVMNNLYLLGLDPSVCDFVRLHDTYYLLSFGGRKVQRRGDEFSGLRWPYANPGLTEIDREGDDAVLYRITGCDGEPSQLSAASTPGR